MITFKFVVKCFYLLLILLVPFNSDTSNDAFRYSSQKKATIVSCQIPLICALLIGCGLLCRYYKSNEHKYYLEQSRLKELWNKQENLFQREYQMRKDEIMQLKNAPLNSKILVPNHAVKFPLSKKVQLKKVKEELSRNSENKKKELKEKEQELLKNMTKGKIGETFFHEQKQLQESRLDFWSRIALSFHLKALCLKEYGSDEHPIVLSQDEIVSQKDLAARYKEFDIGLYESPFRALGLSDNASLEDVKKAYRKLAVILHPDKRNCIYSKEQFQLLDTCYKECLDIRKKAEAD